MRTSKGSRRHRRNSAPNSDTRGMNKMAMNRKATRQSFAANEIETPTVNQRKVNQAKLDAVQKTMKPIRGAGQNTLK